MLLLFIVGKQKTRKINTYGAIAMVWVRFFTDNNYFIFLLAILIIFGVLISN